MIETFIPLIIVFVAVFVWHHSRGGRNEAAEACAKDVIQLLREDRNASPEQLAAVFKQHRRSASDVGQVTRLLKPRLRQAGIRKEDQSDIMIRVRQAKMRV